MSHTGNHKPLINVRRTKRIISGNTFPAAALLVSLSGFALFYLIPFVVSAMYAFTENPLKKSFVGLQNFIDIFQNKFFLLGLKNTFVFMLVGIPLSMTASLLLALALKKFRKTINLFSVVFLIPLILPSATTAQFCTRIFTDNGVLNTLLQQLGIESVSWLTESTAASVVMFIFIWKNLGYNMILFMAGLNAIPEAYYSCATVFGAGAWQRFRHITAVYLTPTFFLVFIMSFVNSFKIFREVYLIWHEYPPESVYLLQHFVNSTLLSLHYQRLVSAVYVLTVVIVFIVVISFRFEHRFSKNLSD